MRKFNLHKTLGLAVVGCLLAVGLTGCTQQEIIDWVTASPSESSAAVVETVTEEEESEPDHVYDDPNPECDAKIDALINELYALESAAYSDLDQAIDAARAEYHALPASQQTWTKKYSIAMSHLSAVQSYYDSAVGSIISEMRSILREYNQPEDKANWAESYYASAKASMISRLS